MINVWRRVTGRGYMDVNRISGYIPGKMVFFLMQVLDSACPPQTTGLGTIMKCSFDGEHCSRQLPS